MTPEELKEIKERAEKATPGPWNCSKDCQVITQTKHITRDVWYIPRHEEDMRFIAHARSDIPALIAEVEILRRILAEVVGPDWPEIAPYLGAKP